MKINARFYISEISEQDSFKKVRKNLETIVNAALIAGDYNKKSWAYQLLGNEHDVVVKYLSSTVKNFKVRCKYRILRKITKCVSSKELLFTYNYQNLKLEKVK